MGYRVLEVAVIFQISLAVSAEKTVSVEPAKIQIYREKDP
jgi:hypothetical protein